MNSFLRARLCKHEFDSVRSISFISTVVKSPDEASDVSFEKTFCLMNIAPKTFCLTNQLFGSGATNSLGLGAQSF